MSIGYQTYEEKTTKTSPNLYKISKKVKTNILGHAFIHLVLFYLGRYFFSKLSK